MEVLALDHAAEARADGVEVDDVGHVEDGLRVVLDARGRLLLEPFVVVGHAARAGEAHVHPHGRGARAAVEGDDQRPLADVGDSVLRVTDIEHLGHDLPVVADRDPPRLDSIGDGLAVEGARLLRDHGLGGKKVGFLAGLGAAGRSRGRRAGATALGERAGGVAQNERGGKGEQSSARLHG